MTIETILTGRDLNSDRLESLPPWARTVASAAYSLQIALGMRRIDDLAPYARGGSSQRAVEAIRTFLPNVLHPLYMPNTCGLDNHRFIILNRNYKPIGAMPMYMAIVDYEEFPQSIVHRADNGAESLWNAAMRVTCPDIRFFFHDHDAPWCGSKHAKNYLRRLLDVEFCP